MRDLRYVAVCFSLAGLAVGLAGCGGATPTGPIASVSGVTRSSSGTPGSSTTGGAGTSSSSSSRPGGSVVPPAGSFVLAEGKQWGICGITLHVKFVPPSATGGSQDQAFLVAGPVASGDQPQPGAVAPANPGGTATVLGRRFRVIAVNPADAKVTLQALC